MITKSKIVLLASKEVIGRCTYEAIELITDVQLVRNVWRRNKTPLIENDTTAAKEATMMYLTLKIPDYIFRPDDFVEFCHKHDFESGEFISGEKIDTAKEECVLCDIANHMGIQGPTYIFNAKTQNSFNMIIYESKNFFVKIELGSIRKGMLMINTKKHILSAAEIPREQKEEYFQVMRDIEFLLTSIYGEATVLFFEHGSSPDGISSHKRSIVHAHTHVVWGVEFPEEYKKMVCLKPSTLEKVKGTKYFSYQEGTKGQFLAVNDPDVYVQRQYPRQVIALMEGITNSAYNWRVESFDSNMDKTFEDIYMYLTENKEFLSERILKATEGFIKGYSIRKNQ